MVLHVKCRWGRSFPPVQTDPEAHPASCKIGTLSFSGVKCGRGVLLTTHLPSSAAVMEEKSYTSTHPLGHTFYTSREDKYTFMIVTHWILLRT